MNDSQILTEQRDDKLLVFLYDESGSPIGMQYRTKSMAEGTFYTYLFEKNFQGDIIAVYNTSGTKLISYYYDAWGNFVKTTHNISGTNVGAQYNPFLYRGYYYDTELGFYYLQSRYYDPFYGRFINADSYLSTGTGLLGYNMYAYCNNNPISYIDSEGKVPDWIKDTVKWVTQNIVIPVEETAKNILSKLDLTLSKGISINASTSIFTFGFQLGLSIDTEGNIALQYSFSSGFTGGFPSASISMYETLTNAPSIYDLTGMGYQIGGSYGAIVYGVPVVAGGNFDIIPSSNNGDTYYGITSSAGLGVPGKEFYVTGGMTGTVSGIGFNVFDFAESIFQKIMEW